MKLLTTAAAAAAALFSAAFPAPARTAWFEDARFGMFIHWGVYSVAGQGEWYMHNHKVPVAEYEKLVPHWRAEHYDPTDWVRLARETGMRYIVITSKHHDGFALFDSALTDYDAVDQGPHKDLIRELVDASRSDGMPLLFYHSWLDWHHPLYATDISTFPDYVAGQVRELCTNYGEIAGIWFDGEWTHPATTWRSDEVVRMIRDLQPKAIINDRLGSKERGKSTICDFYCAEQMAQIEDFCRRAEALGKPWEACLTIGAHHWGYFENEKDFKTTEQLIRTLATVACHGGNLLLNVGPMPDGRIQPELVERLNGIRRWMRVNGRSIYGTKRGPSMGPGVLSTRRGSAIYVHLWDLPSAELELTLSEHVLDVRLLSGNTRLVWNQNARQLRVALPDRLPDPADTVVRIAVDP